MHSSQNNPEKSYAEEKTKHIPSDCAWYLTCSFDSSNNKHSFFRGDDCNERLCENFEELVLEIINYEEKEIISLTNEETKSYEEQKVCHICRKEFITDKNDKKAFKIYHKVRDRCCCTGKFRGYSWYL